MNLAVSLSVEGGHIPVDIVAIVSTASFFLERQCFVLAQPNSYIFSLFILDDISFKSPFYLLTFHLEFQHN